MARGCRVAMALCCVLLPYVARPIIGLKLDDLTEEQREEAMRQRDMLTDMLGQLEGLTEEDTKIKIGEFTPQQRELLKAYYEHKQKQAQDTSSANARLTPEQQQEMIKSMYEELEGKSYGEQEAIKKKWTAQQKDLFSRYEDYQKRMQEEYAEKRAKELGQCEPDEMYPMKTATGQTDFTRPVMGRCRRVHIWDEELGDDGARALATEILAHPGLFVALSLDTTEISANGAVDLARMLKGTVTLEALDVDSNSLGDAGAKLLAEAAEGHPALTTLGLAHNDISDDGANALLKLLRSNYKIVVLPLHGNQISKSVLQSIESLLEKNREMAQQAAQNAANESSSVGSESAEEIVDYDEEETVVVDEDRSDL